MHAPTLLTNFLSCHYLSALERAAEKEIIKKIIFKDPVAELLRKQGQEHEKNHLEFLRTKHAKVVEITKGDFQDRVDLTISAMKQGAAVIYQGALTDGEWKGYADFLVKVDTPSNLGQYSYIVEDTKLSAEVKGEAVLQLCVYAELVSQIQGRLPDEIVIIGGDNKRSKFNPSDFTSYLRYAKKKYLASIKQDLNKALEEIPEPVERCHTCNWRKYCEDQWHEIDHLKLVAGSSRLQRKELQEQATDTLTKLAKLKKAPELKRSSPESVDRVHKQAKIQLKGRISEQPEYEFILPVIKQQGLAGLPEPSDGDIWFDIEGDAHIGELGLEYLFGWVSLEKGEPQYQAEWALDNANEKEAVRRFIQFVIDRRKNFPDLHVYHYGHYEESVIKRLSTRYNLLVDEVDDLLRHEVFINLLRVVKNGLRLSVETYGLKQIEGHYEYVRETDLTVAGKARKAITLLLETKSQIGGEQQLVQDYNEDDCRSTFHLHQWLEQRRDELIAHGEHVPRFVKEQEEAKPNEKLEELAALSERLYKLLPADLLALDEKQKAIKALADLLMWYRREAKSHWWEFFTLKDLLAEEMMDERKGLGGPFQYVGEVGEKGSSTIHRWKFLPQVFEGRGDLSFCGEDGRKIQAKDYEIDMDNLTIDVSVGPRSSWRKDAMDHAYGIFMSSYIPSTEQMERLKNLAERVLDNDIAADGEFFSGRNLLLRKQLLQHDHGSLRKKGESVLQAAIRLSHDLTQGVILPIQGPPGTGKTYTAAHMICELKRAGKKVGITAQSHAVILNLMKQVHDVNEEKYRLKMDMVKQVKRDDHEPLPIYMRGLESSEIEDESKFDVIGATTWVWAREKMIDKVDIMFIDEAGQFALADAMAASHSAQAMVLLGDPQQLENVTQGVHPPEIKVSALGYWLGDNKVIDERQGLFLENTYRMAPGVNAFISETFYEGKLHTTPRLEHQTIISQSLLNGSGVKFIPCRHEGNKSHSMEEVELIRDLVASVLKDGTRVDKEEQPSRLEEKDILIVAPYNFQVNCLVAALPGVSIGTVDKFQGQEAPIVIYSMATSSPEEAPRGMEFLYSLNRLNVAVSRAQCLAVIVASPILFDLSCKTPHQMRLANAFCRFLEMAQ